MSFKSNEYDFSEAKELALLAKSINEKSSIFADESILSCISETI